MVETGIQLPQDKWTKEQWDKCKALCGRGIISHLLTKPQLAFYNNVNKWMYSEYSLVASRKVGKSFFLILLAYSYALKHPKSQITIAAPSQKEVREIFFPIVQEVKQFFPRNIAPRLHKTEKKLLFSNGSVITMDGMQPETIENLRGPKRDLILIDEVMFTDPDTFNYAIRSIFKPQLIYSKTPTIVFASTMAKDVNHPFVTDFIPRIRQEGGYYSFDLFNNPLLTDNRKREIVDQYPLKLEDPEFRREYLCELISASDLLLVPEFSRLKHTKPSDECSPINSLGESAHYKSYVSGDVGLIDFTHLLAGYHNTESNTLFVTEEWVSNYKTLNEIADAWFKLEEIAKNELSKGIAATRCTLDIFDIAAHTLKIEHNMVFSRPIKSKEDDAISLLRNLFQRGNIVISERCPKLITQLESCIWGKDGKISRSNGNHADGIMALVYMCRLINWNKRLTTREIDFNSNKMLKDASNVINSRRSL